MTFPSDSRHRISRGGASRFSPDPVRPDARPVWTLPISGKEFDGQDVAFDGERVYTIRGHEELVAIELKTGEIAWQQRIPFFSPRKKKFDAYENYNLRAKDGVLYLDGGKCKSVKPTEDNILGMLWQPGTIDAATGQVIQDAAWYPGTTRLPTQPCELGDWLIERDEKHRFISATHRLTGAFIETTLPEYGHLDLTEVLKNTKETHRLICEGKLVVHKDKNEQYFQGFRPDDTRWDWETCAKSAKRFKGIELSDYKGGFRYWRGILTLHAERHGWGNVPFIVIDRATGKALWHGVGADPFARPIDNRSLLDPPEGSRDLMLLQQHRVYTCEVQEHLRIQERDFWREKGTGDPAQAEFETIKTFDEPDMPERIQKKEMVFYEHSHRLPMSGESAVISAVDPLTGDEAWSTEKSLTTPFECGVGEIMAGTIPLARSGHVLWARHRIVKEGKRKNDRATYRDSAKLVGIDYNTGEVLSQQKCANRAELAGLHDGHLILKEGKKLVCYA
ncbi:MAG: hypothetical protein AAGH88_05805 [Planctomycetota bacterium]